MNWPRRRSAGAERWDARPEPSTCGRLEGRLWTVPPGELVWTQLPFSISLFHTRSPATPNFVVDVVLRESFELRNKRLGIEVSATVVGLFACEKSEFRDRR